MIVRVLSWPASLGKGGRFRALRDRDGAPIGRGGLHTLTAVKSRWKSSLSFVVTHWRSLDAL
jgi:hypothetical protein